jgi:hypothetical protein
MEAMTKKAEIAKETERKEKEKEKTDKRMTG